MRNNAANGLFCGEEKATRFSREAGGASPFAGQYNDFQK
jgi:hypothetical protein